MSRHKGRRVPPPDPDSIRRSQITTMLPNEAAWDEAEQNRTLDAHLVAAGTVQNRVTGQWHTWISLYGTDLTSWYVGDDGPIARAILMAIQKLFSEWTYTQGDIESMDPLSTLPDDQVRELLAEVAARQLRKN